jgi:hypothetical protein
VLGKTGRFLAIADYLGQISDNWREPDDVKSPAQTIFRDHDEEGLQALLKASLEELETAPARKL